VSSSRGLHPRSETLVQLVIAPVAAMRRIISAARCRRNFIGVFPDTRCAIRAGLAEEGLLPRGQVLVSAVPFSSAGSWSARP